MVFLYNSCPFQQRQNELFSLSLYLDFYEEMDTSTTLYHNLLKINQLKMIFNLFIYYGFKIAYEVLQDLLHASFSNKRSIFIKV